MTNIVRNAILATVAVFSLAGAAYAQQQTITSCSNHDGYWNQCLGAANNGHESGGRGHDRH
ncbi:MAG: hypothetical protein E5X92_13765 [Mesorhizobium sp.]|uniref:hypothetical protein n=1 Tax=unclassified Mesorhizobium TaxID=325217 RepID=UPI0007FE4B73|nr:MULTISPECIES: hypothetical protein [unclassified Mesorhizobium]TIP15119.1 MAG: hypothetical protein E5X92_13765 [Mesorhizobium sp.]OBQ92965.1 hypothetical protein A9K66_28475 [Mesorhizobium sp. AA23]RUW50307.1 hypothetical protein EOA32_19670 [Mesorhizobium sp. M1A.F.Ca.ET.072.01.1.1]TIS17108.1 MAG: hypothetical protein E5X07_34595 [Mesorhizobium sp.]TIV02537.1 MAG: hypothetical protein E5W04_12915 [Mesorhizobium sp.]